MQGNTCRGKRSDDEVKQGGDQEAASNTGNVEGQPRCSCAQFWSQHGALQLWQEPFRTCKEDLYPRGSQRCFQYMTKKTLAECSSF